MKSKLFKAIVFILFFYLFLPRLNAQTDLPELVDSDKTISMDFEDVSLSTLLKALSQQSGMNFIASEAVQDRKMTVYLDKVPLKETMDRLFKANNLSYEFDEEANLFIVKDWGKPQVETITKVYYLKHGSVSTSNLRSELAENMKSKGAGTGSNIKTALETGNILSSNGKVVEDAVTNSLIVTDVPSRFPVIEQVIADLDVPVPQVMIDVEMLDVSKNVVDKLGFTFNNNPLTLMIPGGAAKKGIDFWFFQKATRGSQGAVSLGGTYASILDFLRTRTDTKYLARPRLLTLNNQTAEIDITKDEILEVIPRFETITPNSGNSVTNVTYDLKRSSDFKLISKGIGVTLRVTPQINPDTGEVTMVINPQASTATDSTRAANLVVSTAQGTNYTYTPAEPELRETRSIVKVKDGETVIMGGLIHTEKNTIEKKVPVLGDMPFVGALFRHKDVTTDTERELLVFITPHILKDSGMELAQLRKVSIPEREQTLGQAITRKTAISSSLDTFEKTR